MDDSHSPDDDGDLPDDVRHLRHAFEAGRDEPGVQNSSEGINLLGWFIAQLPRLPWEDMFANDLAARACVVRAYRQLRAASVLLYNGYYSEVDVVLRGAYEAASLSRYLAKDPEVAERWVKKKEWFPEAGVRRWMKETGFLGLDPQQLAAYDAMYRVLSSRAHPTASSCLSLLAESSDGPVFQVGTVFVPEAFSHSADVIAATALFCCLAARNAAVRQEVLDPDWRRQLDDLAHRIGGSIMPKIDRDWAAERETYAAFRDRVQQASELHRRLLRHPVSDKNLKD